MPSVCSARRLAAAFFCHIRAAFTLDTRSLAAYRIGMGLLLVADAVIRAPDVAIMLGPDGIFPLDAIFKHHSTATLWSLAFLHDSSAWSGAVVALEGLAGTALAVGWHTRIATFLGWVAIVSLIRRGSPAVNSGDVWLSCQMFWAMFLPLGERWSMDAVRRRATGSAKPPAAAAFSTATIAVVLQLVAVYLGAGLSKCNADWFTGNALTHALSVHDHGTSFGMFITSVPWLTRPLQWIVVACEIGLPLMLLAFPSPRVRIAMVAIFTLFHGAIWLGMTVGLFPAVGIVAWLPLLPREFWYSAPVADDQRVASLGRTASWACATAGMIAVSAFILHVPPWRQKHLPVPLAMAVNLTALHQEWAMFGNVPARAQWVYGRALLTDGSEVDVLRLGRPVERERPVGGFTSLPHHRWHNFFWHLYEPEARVFAEPAARALVREWNATHPQDRQVSSLEIRYGFQETGGDAPVRDVLVASWPPRSASGAGNLDRFLQATDREASAH